MSATLKSFLAGCSACFEGLFKKPAVVENPRVAGPIAPAPDTVVINGVELVWDQGGWPIEHALGEIMLHLDVSDIQTLYIPTTRLEKFHGIAPRVFVPFQGQTFAPQYVNGQVMFTPYLDTRKIEYQLRGNLVMKPIPGQP